MPSHTPSATCVRAKWRDSLTQPLPVLRPWHQTGRCEWASWPWPYGTAPWWPCSSPTPLCPPGSTVGSALARRVSGPAPAQRQELRGGAAEPPAARVRAFHMPPDHPFTRGCRTPALSWVQPQPFLARASSMHLCTSSMQQCASVPCVGCAACPATSFCRHTPYAAARKLQLRGLQHEHPSLR